MSYILYCIFRAPPPAALEIPDGVANPSIKLLLSGPWPPYNFVDGLQL
jgi:hypothetical protein